MTGAPVRVAVVNSRAEADLVVGPLRSHGPRVAVVTDDAGGQEPQWQPNGVRVLVPPSDEPIARRLPATVEDAAGPLPHGQRRETSKSNELQ